MYQNNKIYNFTNRELYEIANEYISKKLNRNFSVVDQNVNRKMLNCIEVKLITQDSSERKYVFTFYFSDYFMECYITMDSRVQPMKESTDDNLEIMDMFLCAYARKFGVEYIEEFEQVQTKKEEERYNNAKESAKNREEVLVAKKENKLNLEKLSILYKNIKEKINGFKA